MEKDGLKYRGKGGHMTKEGCDGTGVIVHVCNLSAWKAERGGPQGQHQLKHMAMPSLRETKGVLWGDRTAGTLERFMHEKEFKVRLGIDM